MPGQTQDNAEPGAAIPPRPPVPDLGFFAGPPAPRPMGSPAFGSGPAPQAAPFGTPQAAPFGTPQAAPFGTPQAAPFGAPAAPAPAWSSSAPGSGSGTGSGWKVAVAAGAVVVVVALVLVGRFGWQQFVADPVTPATLLGTPKLVGGDTDATVAQIADQFGSELSAGSTTEVALYTDGQGSGYLLFAVRGGSGGPDSSSGGGSAGEQQDPFAGWTKTSVDGVDCWSQPAQAEAGMGTTMCIRGLWRRAVVVFGMAAVPPDPATVARATNEAWDAQ